MKANQWCRLMLFVAAAILSAVAAHAQTPQKPGTSTSPAQVKQKPGTRPPAAATNTPTPSVKPAQKPDTPETVAVAPKTVAINPHPTLLGQYDNWGAYWAAPDGKKVCFAAARPNGAQSMRGRTPAYLFITSRPHDKIKDEVSAIVSYPLKTNGDAMAVVGGKNYLMSAKADGVWIKNQTDESKLVETMRKGGDLVLKATTDRGLQSTDTFSMKGLAQALDRVARECK